jgi:hypothetical protein
MTLRTPTPPEGGKIVIEQDVLLRVCNLVEMLRYRRPANSNTQKAFISKFILPTGAKVDPHGNVMLRIGDFPVMWSSHTDTVHSKEGMQKVTIEGDIIKLPKNAKDSSCLGADCTTGVWIMLEMIKAKVPGLYIFHNAEERGCLGSKAILEKEKYLLTDLKYAIAFDRRAYTSVITFQSGSRCASDAFAESIIPMLPLKYEIDKGGIFTDTATYTEVIPECSNLSVGYEHEHTMAETQSISHALALRNAMVRIDLTKLVCKRDPAKREYSYSNRYYDYLDRRGSEDETVWFNGRRYKRIADGHLREVKGIHNQYEPLSPRTMIDVVKRYPEEVADLLESFGYDLNTLLLSIEETYGKHFGG